MLKAKKVESGIYEVEVNGNGYQLVKLESAAGYPEYLAGQWMIKEIYTSERSDLDNALDVFATKKRCLEVIENWNN